ncbi:MAG: hypothetical protein NTV63_01715 [Candidatus Woesearchaeota archaeon]|nr:hypothetical protein [Candidatus Woesearchaeota archaeon]
MDLRQIIISLENIGLMDVLLPFLLIFSILFAVLSNIKLFGEEKKNINVIIALVLTLTVIIPHVTGSYPAGADVVDIINKSLPNVSLVIVAVIMLLLLVGVWGIKFQGGSLTGMIAFVSIAVVFFIFGSSAGWFKGNFANLLNANPETTAVVVSLLVFGVIIWLVTSEPRRTGGENFLSGIGKIFGGGWNKP